MTNNLLVLLLISIGLVIFFKPELLETKEHLENLNSEICSSLCCCNRNPSWRNDPIVSKLDGRFVKSYSYWNQM
jgi:hypothetical protein